ncbi:hypothetical protein [uncultured Rikenella sp.]|uniref:hypothetical protein n=1 Tax=uncultured Rikenella sp. TaxID=368003 RepID=UPI0025FF4493|nr:hypothetical protein [uncultured Rikenella sp.]
MIGVFDLPAPGNRGGYEGALHDVGNLGYGWSSTVGGTNGVNLVFGVPWVVPGYLDHRTYGFQLRCLSE